MKNLLFITMWATLLHSCGNPQPADEKIAAMPEDTITKAIEITNDSYTESGKQLFAALAGGDMDKYVEKFADDAVYGWNNGDSLAGKQAISDFWRKRRTVDINTIAFSNQIWLPVQVNKPQSVEAPGVWLLYWCQVDVNYKNGKSMSQWMHFTVHFNDNKQIDRMIQYVDMAPVNATMPPTRPN